MASTGSFVISIDYEYLLGFADFDLNENDRLRMESEIEITRRLLVLFDQYKIPATWAVVGHLLETNCSFEGDQPHPEYPRPIHINEKRDWFQDHPAKGEYADPLWFDSKRLVGEIIRSSVSHEIGSHSYAHIIYGAPDVQEDAVKADIDNLKRVHLSAGLPVSSFVFPRNKEGFHELLKDNNFTTYRGVTKKWYESFPGSLGRALRLLDYYLPTWRTVEAQEGEGGLMNVPDSMMLLSRNGLRKLVLPSVIKWKAKKSLEIASEKGETFHFWFHPSNFWYDTEIQFDVLESILKKASALRDNDELRIETMEAAARKLNV